MRAMGRIFVGLLRCGAFGCFDEFNRLGEDVLSAVSLHVQAIQVRWRAARLFAHLSVGYVRLRRC